MTETLGTSVMEFQGDKDEPNGCNREKKPERNHPRKDDYVGVVDVNVQSAWQDTEPNDEGDYGEQSSANQMFEHEGPPTVSRNNYIVSGAIPVDDRQLLIYGETGEVESTENQMAGYPTTQELRFSARMSERICVR